MNRHSLSTLPLELRFAIIDYLAFPETANLRITCRSFAAVIPFQPSNYIDLLAAEDSTWALRHRRLTCVYCARMRHATAFTELERSKTTKEDAQFRCCYECLAAYDLDNVAAPPINYARTRFSSPKTKIHIDGLEVSICQLCHNAFNRWGSKTAKRNICPGCFLDNPAETAMHQSLRFQNDLVRMENKLCRSRRGRRTLGSLCLEDEDWNYMLDEQEQDRWNHYEWWCGLPAKIPMWRGGRRGVFVKSREEAENIYYEVSLLGDWTADDRLLAKTLLSIIKDEEEEAIACT